MYTRNLASLQLRRRERSLRLALANAPTPASRNELRLLLDRQMSASAPGA